MTRKAPMAVHVVLDTSCLFTEAADKLIREELSAFILERLESTEVTVTWHLPEIVRAERKHQMTVRAHRLLPQLAKVESLLGHSFAITAESLVERVEAAIAREIERHKLAVHDLDVSKVHWSDLISRSVQRRPPFDPGEKEKGFRDAIVLETFCQLIEDLPKSPQSCRIVLMTGDQLLTDVARERTADRNNIAFTGDLEVVRTMLNTLASALTQEMVGKILPQALEKFFKTADETTVYYKERIYEQIGKVFVRELKGLPDPEFTNATIKRVLIGAPTFLSKSGQRVRFSSRVTYEMEATKTVWRAPPAGILSPLFTLSPSPSLLGGGSTGSLPSSGVVPAPGLSGGAGLYGAPTVPGLLGSTGPAGPAATFLGATPSSSGTLAGLAAPPPLMPEEIRREGRHVFEVHWSATLTSSGTITRPKVDKIEHKSTTWEEQP